MILRAVRFVNLLLAGMLAGNELGTWAAAHPALGRLSPPERLRAEQELTRRYAAIMPAWMGSALASCFVSAFLSRGTAGFRGTVLGSLCFAAMLAGTRLGNVPINDRTLELTEEDIGEFERIRARWTRLHTLRVALTTAGFAALVSGALSGGGR